MFGPGIVGSAKPTRPGRRLVKVGGRNWMSTAPSFARTVSDRVVIVFALSFSALAWAVRKCQVRNWPQRSVVVAASLYAGMMLFEMVWWNACSVL